MRMETPSRWAISWAMECFIVDGVNRTLTSFAAFGRGACGERYFCLADGDWKALVLS